jgi:hypothetical protein
MLQRKIQPRNAKGETKARTYAAPQLVVLGQARDLLQGGFPPGVYDYNRGYVRR